MLVFGSQMHLLTLIIVILELMVLPFVLWYYFAWPKDKSRLWYFVLLVLLIVYNLTGGLFPDPGIQFISVRVQNVIAYGAGFGMASFFPYYFYASFNLEGMKFHANYGAPLFLIFPFVVFFIVLYPLTGDLNFVVTYGMIVPFLYSPVLLWAILRAIRKKADAALTANSQQGVNELRGLSWAVAPWVGMTAITYVQAAQWIEVLVTNSGFLIISVLFMLRTVRAQRLERERLMLQDEEQKKLRLAFRENCGAYRLSKRESEVSEWLCRGLTYRQIADDLFISERTVDAHVQRIFLKTGVNKKIELQKTLGYVAMPDAGGRL